jgi:hypothetical protein
MKLYDQRSDKALVAAILEMYVRGVSTRKVKKEALRSLGDAACTSSGSCTILTLTLGPLDLTLLELHIHLNQVVLTIDANPQGGILGQLLCSLAGGRRQWHRQLRRNLRPCIGKRRKCNLGSRKRNTVR